MILEKAEVTTLEQLRRSAPCLLPERGCQHRAPLALTPLIIRWGPAHPVITCDSYSGYTGRKLAQRSARSDFRP
jgi:hypothetical protein